LLKTTLGNYTIKAQADSLLNEYNTTDNTFIDGIIKIKILGDINGDSVVDMFDFGIFAQNYCTTV